MARMSLRVAVADDEPLPRERLVRLLREAGCEVVAAFATGTDLLVWLKDHRADALFLDIRMPGITGLEILADLEDQLPVVLVTAHLEYSLAAFEHAAFDYLLKPATPERVAKTLARLERREARPAAPPAEATRSLDLQRFPVRAGDGLVFLDLRRVSHFELSEGWVWAWVQGERYRTPWSRLAEAESTFTSEPFCRIQRHILLRPSAVSGLRPLWGRRVQVRLPGGMELDVSRSMTPHLKQLLGL